MTHGNNMNSANTTMTNRHQPSNDSSGAIKDISKGDSRWADVHQRLVDLRATTHTNTAAGMSNHGAIARVALPKKTIATAAPVTVRFRSPCQEHWSGLNIDLPPQG